MGSGDKCQRKREIELRDKVFHALFDAAVLHDNGADMYQSPGSWWRLRIDHDANIPLNKLCHEAAKDLDAVFTVEVIEEENAVLFHSPALSMPIEVRMG